MMMMMMMTYCCISHVYVYNFWNNLFSLKMNKMSLTSTISNRSFISFVLQKRYVMRADSSYSFWKCFTVKSDWHTTYCGCCSCLKIKECVSLVKSMRNRDMVTFSLLDFRKTAFHFHDVGCIGKGLLCILLCDAERGTSPSKFIYEEKAIINIISWNEF